MLGVAAVFSFFPGLFAKSAADDAGTAEANGSTESKSPVAVRPDARAVARRADTV